MMELRSWIEEKAKGWAGDLTVYTTLGSFILYLVGYLALGFHLTALGIGTDLAILDERYFFAGAKFFVYLVSAIPNVVLLCFVLALLLYLPYAFLPGKIKRKVIAVCTGPYNRFINWCTRPTRLVLAGVGLSVFVIQFFMRKSYFYNNLLLASELPGPVWLRKILLSDPEGIEELYFAGILAATCVTAAILYLLQRNQVQTSSVRFLTALLAVLVAVQALMLPINYAYLIVDKNMPKVSSLGGHPVQDDQDAWLVWEGKQGTTYLVRQKVNTSNPSSGRSQGSAYTKSLVTLRNVEDNKENKKIEITCYDAVFRVLFLNEESKCKVKQS